MQALMWAVERGHAKVVRALLGAGADARRAAQDGGTALGLAALTGHREVRVVQPGRLARTVGQDGWQGWLAGIGQPIWPVKMVGQQKTVS